MEQKTETVFLMKASQIKYTKSSDAKPSKSFCNEFTEVYVILINFNWIVLICFYLIVFKLKFGGNYLEIMMNTTSFLHFYRRWT